MIKASALLLLWLLLLKFSAAEDEIRCNCDEEDFWNTERILNCQKVGDVLIAVAYFSIPVELLYFVSCSNFPFKWVLFQFIAFIGFCGMTHLLNAWAYGPHSFQLMLSLTVMKVLTALVSFATAITLFSLIPMLLKVKVRELMLKQKALDLDQKVLFIKKQNEAFFHVRMLTQEIRKTLDRHTILYTTLVELSNTLDLKNCVIWMPNVGQTEMNVTHQLKDRSFSNAQNSTLPISDPDVQAIIASDGTNILDSESPLAVASSGGISEPESVAAIRIQMLIAANFKGGTPEMVPVCYAILVLVLPDGQGRSWSKQELDIVQVVSDQVAVALSHASVFEESQNIREQLADQNRALQQAKQDALMANQARKTFQVEMSEGLRRPLHSISGLLSVLQGENFSDEQRLVVDSMVKTSSVLSTLITDLVDVSGRDIGRYPLEMSPFQLHSMIREATCLSKCVSASKGYNFVVEVDKSLPNHVLGDERRVFRVILHMVDDLLNRSNGGGGDLIFRVYSASRSQGWNEQKWGQWRSNLSDGFTYIKFEIGISRGAGYQPKEKLPVIASDEQRYSRASDRSMSFNACKKLVQLLQGDIWVMSNPEAFDQGIALALRFHLPPSIVTGMSELGDSWEGVHSNSLLRGLKVLLADSDDMNRAVTRKLLEKLGCIVSSVSSGYECISTLGPGAPSCQIVLMDLHLPDMDGFEVALRIRKFRSRNWPLIIALTSRDHEDTRDKCMQVGMNGIIQKPGTSKEIAYELKRALLQANRHLS